MRLITQWPAVVAMRASVEAAQIVGVSGRFSWTLSGDDGHAGIMAKVGAEDR